MNHPPYHLRINKAIDRLLFVEVLERLRDKLDIPSYTYYGMGGPFLEDCRVIHAQYPKMNINSLESDGETYNRQRFHRFTTKVNPMHESVEDWVVEFSSDGKDIVWLDYPKLEYQAFRDFVELLRKSSHGTIIRLTIPVSQPKYRNAEGSAKYIVAEFKEEFYAVLQSDVSNTRLRRLDSFEKVVFSMVRKAAADTLTARTRLEYQPIHCAFYSDGTRMLSITGVVCDRKRKKEIRNSVRGWKFANVDWADPHEIDVPVLSIKERLALEAYLPGDMKTVDKMISGMSYKLDDDDDMNRHKIEQYKIFYSYYPYFTRILA